MKKYLLIGDEKILARWVLEFPDLVNFIADFIECNENEDLSQLSILQDAINNGSIIVVASKNTTVYEFLKNTFVSTNVFVHIRDFVAQQITDSELMPRKIRIDASTKCQLNCKSCYMRLNNGGTMGNGYLSFDNFRKLIESSPFINEIELSNSGEIFLNPDLIDMMKYAYSKGIRLTAFNGVNFNNVTDSQLESLVKYHFYGMTISIDGASQNTYSKYRINGDFNAVIENIKKLNEYKKRYHSNNPQLVWQYIIMEHNELDVPAAKMKAKELGIPIRFKLTWDTNYQPKHADMLREETGLWALTRNEYLTVMKKTYIGTAICNQMFFSPQINWDGRLLGCCEVFKDDYGVNVFETGLRKALQSRKFINAKRFLLQTTPEKVPDNDFPCIRCEKRLQMKMVNEKVSPFENIGNFQ